jgi:hypothetical protein
MRLVRAKNNYYAQNQLQCKKSENCRLKNNLASVSSMTQTFSFQKWPYFV